MGWCLTTVEIAVEPPRAQEAVWSRGRLIAFRFACVIAAWSCLRLAGFASNFLYFNALKQASGSISDRLFRIDRETTVSIGALLIRGITGDRGPSGDVVGRFGFLLSYLIAVVTLAAAITLIWSAADRRRTNYARLEGWLRVYARHALALVAMAYAMVKVVPTQFGYLTPGELLRPFGRLTGFWVLWNFMAASPAYTVFAGLVELVGAVLLFFPSTTLIGALILAGALTNVFVMDLAYGVGNGATIIAGLLLALDAIVLAPYAGPLLRTLLGHQTGPLPAEPVSQRGRWRYGTLMKVGVVTLLVWQLAAAGMVQRQTYYGAGHPVYGLFDVDSFVRNGTPVVPLANDSMTWKRVASDGRYDSSGLTVQFANGDVRQYRLTDDAETRVWTIQQASKDIATLRYSTESDGSVTLDGRIGDDSVQLRLKRVDLKTLPLFRSR